MTDRSVLDIALDHLEAGDTPIVVWRPTPDGDDIDELDTGGEG